MEFLADLHPKIVHFPVAFLLIYVLLELTGIVTRKDFFQKSAYLFLFLGVLAAVFAVITGNLASDAAAKLGSRGAVLPFGLISEHEQYATITLWYFTFLLVARTFLLLKKKFKAFYKYIFILLAVIGGYFIYQTADRGGKLVYNHGVGTELIKQETR